MANTFVNMDIYINSDGSFQILCPEIKNNNIILDYWTKKNDENKYIQKFFDSLTKQKLLHCYEKEDQRILIVQNDKKVKYKVVLHDYNRLLNIFKFNNLEMKMNKYWMKKAISKVGKKLNLKIENFIKKVPTQFVVAGSLLTVSIMIPSIIASNNKINDTSTINNPSITQEANLDTSEEETEEIVINKDKINDGKDTDIKNNEKIETLIIDENDFKNTNIEINNENLDNYNQIDFSELKNFNTINQYIAFASNLYSVDIETSKKLLSDKVNNMEYYISNSNNTELKNLYELKNLGVINGDLDVMGTFIIIKNYAIDNLGITNQDPIISNKTPNEKEKDMIDIARYIYGIENNDLLNNMIAIHRLETRNGTSNYATKLNNFGGNMNANPSQEQINRFERIIQPKTLDLEANPIPNIYKTAEIGEESMVRNFLNVYSKCLHDEECIGKNNIADFLSKKYCTHTPEEWAIAVNSILNEGTIQETVEEYIDNNNKTL